MGGSWNNQRVFAFLHFAFLVSSVYVYNNTPVYYRDARLACEAGNGQLVVLDSQEKTNDFAAFMAGMKGTYSTLGEIWFALSYDTSWEKFIWPDDSDVTWTHWDEAQPSGHQPSPDPQLCGRIRRKQGFRLSTTFCNNYYSFACETASSVYTYVDIYLNYHDAIIHCRGRCATLLKLDSQAKVDAFTAYVNASPAISSDVEMWTSLTYDLSWNSFLWLDDVQTQISTFDYWAYKEPDNNPPNPEDRPFLCGRASDASAYQWTMIDCRQLVPYACEYDDSPMTTTEASLVTVAPRQFVDFVGLFKLNVIDKKPLSPAFNSLSASSVKECTLLCVRLTSCAFIHFVSNVCSLHHDIAVGCVEEDPSAEIWERF